MPVFDLRNHPVIYQLFKMLALANVVVGIILLTDFYLPYVTHTEEVVEKKIKMEVLGDGSALLTFQVITSQHVIDAGDKAYSRLQEGDSIWVNYTSLFEKPLGFHYLYDTQRHFAGLSYGIYTWGGFMPKIMIASLFTLLFVKPKHWMAGVTLINSVIMIYLIFIHSWFLIGAATVSFASGYLLRKPLSKYWIMTKTDD